METITPFMMELAAFANVLVEEQNRDSSDTIHWWIIDDCVTDQDIIQTVQDLEFYSLPPDLKLMLQAFGWGLSCLSESERYTALNKCMMYDRLKEVPEEYKPRGWEELFFIFKDKYEFGINSPQLELTWS